jgi:hypothetical protein
MYGNEKTREMFHQLQSCRGLHTQKWNPQIFMGHLLFYNMKSWFQFLVIIRNKNKKQESGVLTKISCY